MLPWIGEKLMQLAGLRAPAGEPLEPGSTEAHNGSDGLETLNQTLAQPAAGRAGPDTSCPPAALGGAQHGVRGRAGGEAHPEEGTRPPYAASRYLNTALGVLSYAELAPHLATRVQALQSAIVAAASTISASAACSLICSPASSSCRMSIRSPTCSSSRVKRRRSKERRLLARRRATCCGWLPCARATAR